MTTGNFPYAEVFAAVQQQVIDMGSKQLPREQVEEKLDTFRFAAERLFSDDDYYWVLVYVSFYSGFRAATVTSRLEVIRLHFPSWQVVAEYSDADIARVLLDSDMIAHEGKVRGCVKNAQTMRELVGHYGSFQMFLNHHLPDDSFEKLLLLKEVLETKFAYLGGVTVYHFMTDIGLNVLKPDRVICRLFERLGLLEDPKQLLKAIMEGRKFAAATNLPIRYIDRVLVAYGQQKSPELGIEAGVCLDQPRCDECGIRTHCHHVRTQHR